MKKKKYITLNPFDIWSDVKVNVNPRKFARCDKHLIPLNSQGYCQRCYEKNNR